MTEKIQPEDPETLADSLPDQDAEAAPSDEPSVTEGVRLSEAEASRHAKCGNRVNQELWDKLYADWKGGIRFFNTLAKKYGLSFSTVRKIVVQGNKHRHWPPFAVRLELEGQTLRTAESMAGERIADQLVDDWEKAREQDLKLVQANKAMLGRLITKFMAETKDVQYAQEGYDKDGNKYYTPMTGSEAVRVASMVSQAISTLTQTESLLLGKPTQRTEIKSDPFDRLTVEQMQHLAQTGELPPGVTEEDLLGASKSN